MNEPRTTTVTAGITALILLLLTVTAAYAQQPSSPRNGEGPQTFVDLKNFGHSTGFSIYVPSGWYIDHFPTERDGRTRSYLPGGLGTEFEQPVILCQDRYAIPPSIDPNSLVAYHCSAEGTGTIAPLSVRMIDILALGSPLEIHMRILDEDSRFVFGTKRIANISDTTIPVVNAATNQTIREIPAQIAQVELTDPITATGEPLTYVNTVLYANLPETESKDTYIVSWMRPKALSSGTGLGSNSSLDVEAKAILDSFRVVVNSPGVITQSDTPATTQQLEGQQSPQELSQRQQQMQQPLNQGATVTIVSGASSLTYTAFQPNPVQVSVGGSVTWTNDDTQPHTVISGANGIPDGKFDSSPNFNPLLAPGQTFSHTFTEAGEYPYFCILHPNMVGTVISVG